MIARLECEYMSTWLVIDVLTGLVPCALTAFGLMEWATKAPSVLLMRRVHSHHPSHVVLGSANSLFPFCLVFRLKCPG